MARCVATYADTYNTPRGLRTVVRAIRVPASCVCCIRTRGTGKVSRGANHTLHTPYTYQPRGRAILLLLLPRVPCGTTGRFELPEAVDLDDDLQLQRALNASSHGVGDPYVRFPLPSLSARARTAAARDAAGQANRNFVRAYLC